MIKKYYKIYLIIGTVILIALTAYYFNQFKREEHSDTLYTCPMNPEIIRNQPGKCPICHMDLVLLKKEKKEKQETPQKHDLSKLQISL